MNEFTLKNVDFDKFCMNGANLCALGKDRFLDLAPDFVGDILWEHLDMLQKGMLERGCSVSEYTVLDTHKMLHLHCIHTNIRNCCLPVGAMTFKASYSVVIQQGINL